MANKLVSLRRKSDFSLLKEQGKRASTTRWLLAVFLENDLDHCRYGWTIPKQVGSSVIRNRLKRWLRDYFRDKSLPKPIDINMVVRAHEKDFFKHISRDDFINVLHRTVSKIR